MKKLQHLVEIVGVGSMCLVLFASVGMSKASAQPAIFSFENAADLDPWILGASQSGVTQTIARSSLGATDGTSALLIDNIKAPDSPSGNFKVLATTPNFNATTAGLQNAFAAFNSAAQVIAEGRIPKLEFDLTWDFSGAAIPATGGYIQMGMFVNSSSAGGGGFKQYGTSNFINSNSGFSQWPSLGTGALNDGVTLTPLGPTSTRVSIPFAPGKTMTLPTASTFFDIGFQSNGRWDGDVDFAIDNLKFTGVPVYEEHTLFSWETPDNPATSGVNEQLEGWMPNPTVSPPTQNLSITTTGATNGNSALQLDRRPLQDGFTWGSAFGLDANANPSVQTRIDDLVARINGASQIAIDITYQDQFPISPSGTKIYLAFTDQTGAYYQAGSESFNINNAPAGTKRTLFFDLAAFGDFNNPANTLENTGLLTGTHQLGIVLGTATNDGAVYQLDNFRVITEVTAETGDFDGDGDVDGRDFLVWQRGGSPTPGSASDLALWQSQYNTTPLAAVSSVPEPAAVAMLAMLGLAFVGRGRRI